MKWGIPLLLILLSTIVFFSLHLPGEAKEPVREDSNVHRPVESRLVDAGYLDWVDVGEDNEVMESAKMEGFNLYTSTPLGKAYIADMQGNILYTLRGPKPLQHIEVYDGFLYAIHKNSRLIKYSFGGEKKDEVRLRVHHDMDFTQEGVVVIANALRNVSVNGSEVSFWDEELVFLDKNLDVLKRYSVFDAVDQKLLERRLMYLKRGSEVLSEHGKYEGEDAKDILHVNTLDVLKEDVEGLGKKGDLLICIRNLDSIVVYEPESEKIAWNWGRGVLDHPHQPTILENGDILVLDNGFHRNYSRLLEVDPVSKNIVLEYTFQPKEMFYSKRGGGVQKLDDGSLLVTECDKGKAFEIDEEGNVVWEYYNPDIFQKKRSVIYRMQRLDPDVAEEIVEAGQTPG